MSPTNGASAPSPGGERISRRAAVLELAGMAAVLAIPVGAALATANPIPNPPSRKTLNFTPLVNPVAEQQQREAEKETRRSGRKRRASGESRRASRDEEQRPSATEQRASQP